MGNRPSNYSELPEIFEWREAYVDFRFDEDKNYRLRVHGDFHIKPDGDYFVDIPDKVKQRIMDGENGVAVVYTNNNMIAGQIKLKPHYWHNYELEYHPQHYRDYIPHKQPLKGLIYKIRHTVANYPDCIIFYKR
jgi:hypothetical protein